MTASCIDEIVSALNPLNHARANNLRSDRIDIIVSDVVSAVTCGANTVIALAVLFETASSFDEVIDRYRLGPNELMTDAAKSLHLGELVGALRLERLDDDLDERFDALVDSRLLERLDAGRSGLVIGEAFERENGMSGRHNYFLPLVI